MTKISAHWIYFYPRPPRGGRPFCPRVVLVFFLISIHALREEGDQDIPLVPLIDDNFYPRPPRGGRLDADMLEALTPDISIHALREEGDL